MRPPFYVTPPVLALCTEIGRLLGRAEGRSGARPQPQLRRGNRIRTVQASVAIEGNSLSIEQVSAIVDGKRVAGDASEVREVENAIRAYALAPRLDPGSAEHLLRAHRVMMAGLAPDAGRWRARDVGVIRRSKVAHIAPPAHRVPALMADLLAFVADDAETPLLIKACVAHYEIEFIHPFTDGNGRIGRLWQQVILLRDSPAFAFVPTESIIKERQALYYKTLAACDRAGDSTRFIAFSLGAIRDALAAFVSELRPPRLDADGRLQAAREHFRTDPFSRRDYLDLHRHVGTATASRDLRRGTESGTLRMQGHKATARYRFAGRALPDRNPGRSRS